MDLEIVAEGFELDIELRQSIEQRMHALATRLGPIASAKLTVAKARWTDVFNWKAKAEIELPPTWTIRPDATGSTVPEALDALFVDMTALMRHVSWARDGVPKPCGWCGGETFVYVRHPADADESSAQPMRLVRLANREWRGELEALVCRSCGHVEWFVADPQRLPVGTEGVELVTTRKPDPYRDPG